MASQVNLFEEIRFPINGALTTNEDVYFPPFDYAIVGREQIDYYWIYVCGGIFAFTMAIGIGANDVANSFATSVGSRTLKMWQALVIAGFCEFFGAYLLGGRVTDTIRSGIISGSAYTVHADLLMIGMLCALISTTFWLGLATALEFPVSTTHSIVGAIIGFGLCSPAGGNSVAWNKVGDIVAGWFIAPLMCGSIAAFTFILIRTIVLRKGDLAYDRAFKVFPFFVFATFTIVILFILKKGGVSSGKGITPVQLSTEVIIGISFGCGAFMLLVTFLILNPLLRRIIDGFSEERLNQRYLEVTGGAVSEEVAIGDDEKGASAAPVTEAPKATGLESRLDKFFHQEAIHAHVQTNERVAAIHAAAEKFPIKAEVLFGYLQVFTACAAAFAHGANDVANAVGPFAAIVGIFNSGVLEKKSAVPDWVLVMGGAGIVVGLALFGHIIIGAIGVKMIKVTPSRGFVVELSTAFVILLGSFLGLPLSSTQTAIGGILGVGIAEGNIRTAVNWPFLARTFLGWVLTLIIAGAMSGMVFSFATFSPQQIYPLSMHNCIVMYGTLHNTTAGSPASYTQAVDAQGTIKGFYGYPVNGNMYDLDNTVVTF